MNSDGDVAPGCELRGLYFTRKTLDAMECALAATLNTFCHFMPPLDPAHRVLAERLVLAQLIGHRAIYAQGRQVAERDAWLTGVFESAQNYADYVLDPDSSPPDWSAGFGRP
jgi:hypothetical protein